MSAPAEIFNAILGLSVIIAQILAVALIVLKIVDKRAEAGLSKLLAKRGAVLAFIVALTASLGSLIYSEAIGLEPCQLCWYQRIFLYPQVIIFGVALWRREAIRRLGLIFSSIGGAIALFHYYGQMFNNSALPCPATGVSCAKLYFVVFNYITLPMMSASAFILIIAILLHLPKNQPPEINDSNSTGDKPERN
jgi:disulfide bond formation protein DsbB